jgi:HEAT repeat protein
MRQLTIGLFLLAVAGMFLPASRAQNFLGKDAGAWEKILNDSKDPRQRRNAAFALGKLGSDAASAMPSLMKRLKTDDNADVREAAAFALGEIGKVSLKALDNPGPVIEVLAGALKDNEPLVRRSAAYALGNFEGLAKPALTALESAFEKDNSGAVKQNIAWALGKIGPEAITTLKRALRDPDPLVQRDAANSVGSLKDEKIIRKALNELVDCCKVKDSGVRYAALSVLIDNLYEEDKAAAPSIAEALDDPDLEVRQNTALALSNFGGREAARIMPILMDMLKQKANKKQRRQAAIAIYNIGPDAQVAVQPLIQALSDEDKNLHTDAAYALGGIGRRAEAAVPALVQLLADSREKNEARVEAAKALAKIGPVPAAVEAVPTLVRVLENPRNDTKVRERVIWALRPHYSNRRTLPDYPTVFPAFTKILSEPKEDQTRMLHYDCAYMLGMLQKDKAPDKALDTLLDFLHDRTIFIFRGSQGSTGVTGSEAQGTASVKEKGNGDGRVMAVQALMSIGYARVDKRDKIMNQLKAIAANPETLPDLFVKTIAAFQFFKVDSGVPQATITTRLRAIVADPKTDQQLKDEAESLLK